MSWAEVRRLDSSDTSVSKYIFTDVDAIAEAVLYRYPTFEERTVLCISVMSGCPVGCTFCGSGKNFIRNLSATEIVSQVTLVLEDQKIDANHIRKFQIMFMSMGEPLLNWRAVEEAINQLHWVYPEAQLLISTVDPIGQFTSHMWERLIELSAKIDKIGLQFSVHESTDEDRRKLIPYRTANLQGIAYDGIAWFEATGRHPFLNYCVTEHNNSEEDADRLLILFDPGVFQITASVICEADENVKASHERQQDLVIGFVEKLVNRGFSVRMFNPGGQDDVGGGCGQLWHVQDWFKKRRCHQLSGN